MKTKTKTPPREFWINHYEGHKVYDVAHAKKEKADQDASPYLGTITQIHVIEYSAYEALEQRSQKLVEALEHLKEAGKILYEREVFNEAYFTLVQEYKFQIKEVTEKALAEWEEGLDEKRD